MKKTAAFFAILMLSANFLSCNASKTSAPEATIPEYIVPIAVMKDDTSTAGIANAIVVDRQKSLALTNAHVVARGENFGRKFKVQLRDGEWYNAEADEKLINWEADLALLKIESKAAPLLPEAAPLSENLPEAGQNASLQSYVANKTSDGIRLEPLVLNVVVDKQKGGWGQTIGSQLALLETLVALYVKKIIPKTQLIVLYENFVVIKIKTVPGEKEEKKFVDGMSGAPIVVNGEVTAIHSASNGFLEVAIPAHEIKKMLDKIK